MKQTSMKRLLSFVLVFCLLASMFPSMGLAGLASAAEPDDAPGQPVPYATPISTETQLLSAIKTQTEIYLDAVPIIISKPIEIPENKIITIHGANKPP